MGSQTSQVLRLKKLTEPDIWLRAAKHNLREIQAEMGADSHIDANRMSLNRVVAGPNVAAEVAGDAERMIRAAGLKLRRDAVRGIEIIVSLHPASSIPPTEFFTDSLQWVRRFFCVPLLSAVIHLDEAAPHCHFLLLPLVDGRMVGSALVGNRQRLKAMQSDFFNHVGQRYGLARPNAPKRLNSSQRRHFAGMLLAHIQQSPNVLEQADVRSVLLDSLGRDAESLMPAFGLTIPETDTKRGKGFVDIMIQKCKPEKSKHIGLRQSPSPIGFRAEPPDHSPSLSCVGFVPTLPPESTEDFHSKEQHTRVRDDQPAKMWNSERGEFMYASTTEPASAKRNATR